MTAESSEDFHAHAEFYRKFARHGAGPLPHVSAVTARGALAHRRPNADFLQCLAKSLRSHACVELVPVRGGHPLTEGKPWRSQIHPPRPRSVSSSSGLRLETVTRSRSFTSSHA